MAYKEIVSLKAETAITLGGFNKTTRKDNPTEIEGYYLGFKTVENDQGTSKLYIFSTDKGSVGVWGKSDLDQRMVSAKPGDMTLVRFKGMVKGKFGQQYTYSVSQDPDNNIDVGAVTAEADSQLLPTGREDAGYEDETYAQAGAKSSVNKEKLASLLAKRK